MTAKPTERDIMKALEHAAVVETVMDAIIDPKSWGERDLEESARWWLNRHGYPQRPQA